MEARSSARTSVATDGTSVSSSSITVAMCKDVVNMVVRFCPMFTSRAGLTGTRLPIVPPSRWIALLARTSLTFVSVSLP
jgi:hypothetical protein